ncbi:unannotated protein [freshwater metagenome]|uniref:Unannotated protein n=1 Tax=freshwater metagenome TaxID=449393 RepID=A0A6J6XUZ6_9ZZZZ
MNGNDHIGAGDVENLVAALMSFKVLEPEVISLKAGSHRAIGDNNSGSNASNEP